LRLIKLNKRALRTQEKLSSSIAIKKINLFLALNRITDETVENKYLTFFLIAKSKLTQGRNKVILSKEIKCEISSRF